MGLTAFRALPPTDRILALALEEYESGLCSGCGLPVHETYDPDNERAFEAALPVRCHACTTRDKRAAEYDEAKQREALRFPVTRKPERKQQSRPSHP